MKCANCENHKHFECIDCLNDHKTYLCECDCHDASTKPHKLEKHWMQESSKTWKFIFFIGFLTKNLHNLQLILMI